MSRYGGGNPGWSNMLWGAVWCIGGTTVTVFSYLAAANGGGRKSWPGARSSLAAFNSCKDCFRY